MTYCLIQLQVKNTLKINNMKYIINAPDSLKYITEPTTKILDNKVKEYKSKYNNYNTDTNVRFDADYKVICEGYRNSLFEEFAKNI